MEQKPPLKPTKPLEVSWNILYILKKILSIFCIERIFRSGTDRLHNDFFLAYLLILHSIENDSQCFIWEIYFTLAKVLFGHNKSIPSNSDYFNQFLLLFLVYKDTRKNLILVETFAIVLNKTDVTEWSERVTTGGRGWCFQHIPLIRIQASQEGSQLLDSSWEIPSVGHQERGRAKICTQ